MVTALELTTKKCLPCEGGIPKLTEAEAQELAKAIPEWHVTPNGERLRRTWRVKDFMTGLDFFQRVGTLAEEENHHPDLHLSGYRDVTIEIWTHAIGGLSENDFILASKINQVTVELKN